MFNVKNSDNIKIHGLYIKGLYSPSFAAAIAFENVSHLEFGAPGKGNLVNGFQVALYSSREGKENRDYVIKGNMFGTNDMGTAIVGAEMENVVDLTDVKDIIIGGNAQGESNLICTGLNSVYINFNTAGTPGFLKIYNNKIGTDVTGLQKLITGGNDNVQVNGWSDGIGAPGGNVDLKLEFVNNIVSWRMNLSKLRDTFLFKGNRFGLGAYNKVNLGKINCYSLYITTCGPGIISFTGATKMKREKIAYFLITLIPLAEAVGVPFVTGCKELFFR